MTGLRSPPRNMGNGTAACCICQRCRGNNLYTRLASYSFVYVGLMGRGLEEADGVCKRRRKGGGGAGTGSGGEQDTMNGMGIILWKIANDIDVRWLKT